MKYTDTHLDDVRAEARANIGAIAVALLGPFNKALSNAQEQRHGKKGGFRVYVSGPKRGGWADFNGSETGDPLGLVRHVQGCSFPQAVEWVGSFLGLSPDGQHDHEQDARRRAEREAARASERAKDEEEARAHVAKQLRDARRLAAEAGLLENAPQGSPGRVYLPESRGTARPLGGWPNALRYHEQSRALLEGVMNPSSVELLA